MSTSLVDRSPPAVRLVADNRSPVVHDSRSISNLLERDASLKALTDALREAAAGTGRIALVHGEAGIGKTTLVESFLTAHRAPARILLGRCDALSTPEPLGPLYDIAHQTGGALFKLISSSDGRLAIFSALLHELQGAIPTVLVLEDIHWADAATLDLLKFLGRRIRTTPVLIILTYRDDELDGRHALWSVLGNLPADATRRVRLEPLTEAAVARLAQVAGQAAGCIYAQTGGNPFYVTELLSGPPRSIPATVREATLARAIRLSPEARAVLELCSVVPNRIELWLLDEPSSSTLLDECIATGLIIHGDSALMFRHELAREAVESVLPQHRLQSLHAIVLGRLLERGASSVATARLVHHASRAGDGAAVRRYAPEAAREASALGAHREAAAHYQSAIDHAAADDIEMLARLSEHRAYECFFIGQMDDAIMARERALGLRRQQGNPLKIGDNLRWLARLAWFGGHGGDARRLMMAAIEILERLPEGPELAAAYSGMAQLDMLAENCEETARWGSRAMQLAERFGLTEILVHSLNNIGYAEFLGGKPEGTAKLERSLELALSHEMHEHAARAHTNLIRQALVVRDYAGAAARLADGLAYTRERDHDTGTLYMLAMRSRANLEQGLWQKAEEDAATVLRAGETVAQIVATVVLGCLRLRRGDSEVWPLLDRARKLALAAGDIMRIAPMAAARAEAAWLSGDSQQMREEAQDAYELALKHPEPWRLGELSLWLWRAGALEQPPDGVAAPYRLEMSGDWRAAAAAWQRIGCPYEQALALAGGNREARLHALDILTGLGATPAAAIVRRNLRAEDARGVPRGPCFRTRDNPVGLTDRQVDILCLLPENLSNKEIAAKLQISPKTVDHHICATLAKLAVATRKEAARHAVTGALLAKYRGAATENRATLPM